MSGNHFGGIFNYMVYADVKDHLCKMELPGGGYVLFQNAERLVQTVFEDPTLHPHYIYSYEPSQIKGELWTGSVWKTQQEMLSCIGASIFFSCELTILEGDMFPLIGYSDKTN